MHILIVEDDLRIAANIKTKLNSDNFSVTLAQTFEDGLFRAETETYDCIVLDWMLPDGDGLTLCKKIRGKENTTPVLFLTAKSDLEDKIEGLAIGADDYLTKPFAMAELLARVKALIRRKEGKTESPILKIADLEIDTNRCSVKRAGYEIALAPREYSLLEFLARNSGKALDRETLLHHVWGEDIDPFSNTIDVHIRYLRSKIDDGYKLKLLKTVKGKGYMLCER